MSTFGGKIQEVPGICVDRFDRVDDCEAYFLSHCHYDHMVGLYPRMDRNFSTYLLNNEDVFVYCSPVSLEILKRKREDVKHKLRSISDSTAVKIKDKYLSVTTIPAGHCPGSVMFLFEYGDKTVLYTGDYRISTEDLKKFKAFYYNSGGLKKIDNIYLDTTFFSSSYENFPNRSDIIDNLSKIIQDWINRSNKHIINIVTPATYGSENFFIQLSGKLKMPIHVSEEKYDLYKCIPEMDGAITTDGNSTKLHSSCASNYRFICKEFETTRIVKPSCLIWDNDFFKKANGAWIKEEDCSIRVCYACHASYNELCGLLEFLKPLDVVPCVVPYKPEEEQRLNNLLNKYKRIEIVNEECNKSPMQKKISINFVENEVLEYNEIVNDLLDSPPLHRKKLKM